MRRRRLRRRRHQIGELGSAISLLICFVSVIRLMSSLGLGAALDQALIKLGSNGGFVNGALEAQVGSISGSYEKVLASASSLAAAAVAEEAVYTAKETPVPTPDAEIVSPAPTADIILYETEPEPLPESSPSAELNTAQPIEFTQSDADAIEYTNNTSYIPDSSALLAEPLEIDFSVSGPLVLIVHTHSCEAYTQEYADQYEASDSWRTTDQSCNIVAVGDELERVLTEAGIGVIHDTTVNDYPAYTGSYTRTLEVIERNLEQYPSIQIVIDLHRDSGVTETGESVATYYDNDGETTSQIMLVVGTDEGGLPHEGWRENLKLALALQATANADNPGLMRPINLRQERFNQHATYGSLIVETGFAGNTLAEAKAAIRLFGDSFCRFIQGRSESQ